MSGPVYGAKGWVDIPDKAHVEAPDGWIVASAMAAKPIIAAEVQPTEPVKNNLVSFARASATPRAIPSLPRSWYDIALLEAVFASASRGKLQAVA